jgi:CRP-like cAMP-binding protein
MHHKELSTHRPASSRADNFATTSNVQLAVAPLRCDDHERSPVAPRNVVVNRSNEASIIESNHLLWLLQRQSPAEYDLLAPHLESVTLERRHVIFQAGGHIRFVYFPEGCVASVVKILSDGKRIEVGTAGLEGMAGFPAFLDASPTSLECFIQVPGQAKRLHADALREAASPGSAFRSIVQRYSLYLYDQAAQSVACNRLHSLNERCARWLLMTHDRVKGEQFELTHEFLAIMLGVRRSGVSEAAEALQRQGFIRYSRGKVSILDRAGLEGASCECYASDRADFERLLSPAPDSSVAGS